MAEQSIWSLVSNASFIVQCIMMLLLIASMVSWYMIVQRGTFLAAARTSLVQFEKRFWSGMDLSQLYKDGASKRHPAVYSGVENVFRAGFKEFTRLRQQLNIEPEAVMDGTQRAMRVALVREEEQLETHLAFLATVGSVSPYVGLFGTVWGIMNSFIGLANNSQATLSVVAPGIAEALIATAMGLFAAIPAVVAYNRFSSKVESLFNAYDTFADEFSSILHRQAHVDYKRRPTTSKKSATKE